MSKLIFTDNDVHNSTEERMLLKWNEWNPGLDNDHLFYNNSAILFAEKKNKDLGFENLVHDIY